MSALPRYILAGVLSISSLSGWAGEADTLLSVALRRCDAGLVRQALAQGADPNLRVSGAPALMRCLDNEELSRALLQAGADPNATRGGNNEPALLVAAKQANQRIVNLLLAKGAAPNARDDKGHTAVTEAAQRRDAYHILKALLDKGGEADTRDNTGQTPLMFAARRGYTAQLELLLARGADPNTVDNQGQSALFYAIRQGYVGTVQTLLRAGADIDASERGNQRTPLMVAVRSNQLLIVSELILAGANKRARDKSGKTAYDQAKAARRIRLAELLKP